MDQNSNDPNITNDQIDQVIQQVQTQQERGELPQLDDYLNRFPNVQEEIRDIWSVLLIMDCLSPQQSRSQGSEGRSSSFEAPPEQPPALAARTEIDTQKHPPVEPLGLYIGRYQIQRRLGRGGFGTVYLATDLELDRLVAIKLPHEHRMHSDSAKRTYLLEARTLAKLDHPNIVPVYDFGILADGRCFVVSKYVDGQDLAQILSTRRFAPIEAAKFVITVAEALHNVHMARVVHRDIKPANLLVGNDGRIFVADFGLALAETGGPVDKVRKDELLGTPGYMSPEQIRREGHRIDGRSDQFSLGIVFYELLTGERPFKGGNSSDLMRKILVSDPTPPSQLKPEVPAELSRICMKLLSRLASDRYPDMLGLAKDLRGWNDLESINANFLSNDTSSPVIPTTQQLVVDTKLDSPSTEIIVIPRGLRAFSRKDAYFFMNLMPGTRDRDGIPESISHWLSWISTPDYVGDWNRVGVISGPTGCGKSSLVRAGLIPLLSPKVTTVIVEASPDLTERQLLQQLERFCDLTPNQTLPDAVMEIRRGGGLPKDQKLLIIIDQFEQWLHGNTDPLETELLQAVRQCDGRRVQCLLLIRDDFWLALSRFMKAAEAPLQLGRNAVMVDLFDQRHAKKVLIEFGRGYGALPGKSVSLSRDQERFIDGAIQSLTVENKVIPVQLSLFAEMVKSREWTIGTLHRLGGAVGVGSQFLNEAFSVTYAPANQRIHEQAAKSVLRSMLPKAGTDIKACQRTLDEIRESSGYSDRTTFDSLLTILESELKLITATDTYDRSKSESSSFSSEPVTYQLSHDFLVPSIREWLSAQQKRTWQGRVEQAIARQAEHWVHHRQRRFLPSLWEWLQSLLVVRRRRLSSIENEMLRARDRLSFVQLGVASVLLIVGLWIAQSTLHKLNLRALVGQLQVAETSQVERMLDQIETYGPQGQAELTAALQQSTEQSREAFLLQLGLVKRHSEHSSDVLDFALNHSALEEVPLACQALKPYASELAEECWKIVANAETEFAAETPDQQVFANESQIRALVLLASLDPQPISSLDRQAKDSREAIDENGLNRWIKYGSTATKIVVRSAAYHPDQYNTIIDSLKPVSRYLVDSLARTVGQPQNDSLSFSAISLLRDFLRDDSPRQTDLCLHASAWQRPYLVPAHDRLSIDVLQSELNKGPSNSDPNATVEQRTKASLRRAMAATLLLASGRGNEQAWSIIRRSSDLTSRSHAIQLAVELGVPIQSLQQQLSRETDPGILAALLQILGEIDTDRVKLADETRIQVASLYREHPDRGVHSSAKWCLTQWNDLATINSLAKSTAEQNRVGPADAKQWMITSSGDLMMKVPASLPGGNSRDLLVSAHEVTVEQFRRFSPGRYFDSDYSPAEDCPASIVKWGDAIAYCNWLSEQEGFETFYPKDTSALASWQPSDEDLKGLGYRLPQESEWEFAARAGTTTDRPNGTDDDLVERYEWCSINQFAFSAKYRPHLRSMYSDQKTVRSKPIGQLRPNEFGLFDVLANVSEWCNDLNGTNRVERAIRGGATAGRVTYLHVNHIGTAQPNQEYLSNGFRVVRTLP